MISMDRGISMDIISIHGRRKANKANNDLPFAVLDANHVGGQKVVSHNRHPLSHRFPAPFNDRHERNGVGVNTSQRGYAHGSRTVLRL